MTRIGIKHSLAHSVAIGIVFAMYVASFANQTSYPTNPCLIPPAYDPGIGGIYFCRPDEGERYLITHARRGQTEVGLSEDIWVNFRGVFNDQVWVNIGLQEASNASLPAWDALASLVEWMQSIKTGRDEPLDAFLAPIELSSAYSQIDIALRKQLLSELKGTASLPEDATLRAIIYHVHLMPSSGPTARQRLALNPLLSVPSIEDLLQVPLLNKMAPGSESKIAVAAGIWTYTWDEKQAVRFVNEFYQGPPETPFPLKYKQVYLRYVENEHIKKGLNELTKLTTERLKDFAQTLRVTGAVLRFSFATDWTAFRHETISD